MSLVTYQPVFVGRGASAKAIQRALFVAESRDPEIRFLAPRFCERNQSLTSLIRETTNPVVFIANPHALHATILKEIDHLSLPIVFAEKPIAVNPDQLLDIQSLKTRVAVFHGYRMTWGVQEIAKRLRNGELGDPIAMECRYWQSSAAARALKNGPSDTWKNNSAISGQGDVILDLVPHWLDLVFYLMNESLCLAPVSGRFRRSFINAESPHRDTHVSAWIDFNHGVTATGSISKTAHGSGNDLEINLLGSASSLHWNFQDPDRIWISKGRERLCFSRDSSDLGSGQSAFHGLGWLEGYIEIIRRGLDPSRYDTIPNLRSSLKVMKAIFDFQVT